MDYKEVEEILDARFHHYISTSEIYPTFATAARSLRDDNGCGIWITFDKDHSPVRIHTCMDIGSSLQKYTEWPNESEVKCILIAGKRIHGSAGVQNIMDDYKQAMKRLLRQKPHRK